MMKLRNKILAFAMAITCIGSTAATAFADNDDIKQQQFADNSTVFTADAHEDVAELGYIPDYFEEHGIDTTQHIPIPMTRTTAQLNTMINSTYPNGSFYSTKGEECLSHASCNYPSTDSGTTCISGCGTCIAYKQAIQCHAFVKYAYYVRNGKQITTGQTSTAYTISDSTISSYFSAGTMVRLKTSNGIMHSVLITANNTSSKTVSIYHANYGGKCKVAYQTISYADFRAAFPSYYYYSNA